MKLAVVSPCTAKGITPSCNVQAQARRLSNLDQIGTKSTEPLPVSNTSQLRDLAQSAARIFGWGEGGVTVNANQALVVTQEQLEQIRQLRGA